jgi:hypothetical protein
MDSFEVENFRSLKHLKLEKLARVNLLVGKNNSGKTSVLEGMYILTGIRAVYWVPIIESARNSNLDRLSFKQLFYNFDVTNSIVLLGSYRAEVLEAPIPLAEMRITIELADRPTLLSREIDHYERPPNTPKNPYNPEALFVVLGTSESSSPVNFELRRNSQQQQEVLIYPKTPEDRTYFEQGPAFIAGPRNLTKLLNTRNNLYMLNDELETLKVDKRDSKIVKVLQAIDDRISRIELAPSGQIYLDLGQSSLLPLNLMGDGIQRLLSILAAIASNAGGIILIDELDNGLHYSSLRVLWKGILQAALEYNVQIFATTHSAEALRHLTWVLDDEENASYRDDVAAYTLVRADDDTVRSYRHDYEQLDYALDHGLEIRN